LVELVGQVVVSGSKFKNWGSHRVTAIFSCWSGQERKKRKGGLPTVLWDCSLSV